MRKLKNLEAVISLSEVAPEMMESGWRFDERGRYVDHVYGSNYLYELYLRAEPGFSGQITVPVLWDRKTKTIVNNESSEIIRMLNSAFDEYTNVIDDYYPEDRRGQIELVNELVFENINLGVYRCGFALTQDAYVEAIYPLFDALDRVEESLSLTRYLTGDKLTEADWRLFTTLIRFESVYANLFKCNLKAMSSYPNISNYLRDLYQHPGIRETVDMDYIKRHYYFSLSDINPSQIIPVGPRVNYDLPHDRVVKFGDWAASRKLLAGGMGKDFRRATS